MKKITPPFFVLVLIAAAIFTVGISGCNGSQEPSFAADPFVQTPTLPPLAPSLSTDTDTHSTQITNVFSNPFGTPAVEECCTQVGRMDECWWEDAIHDGITCTVATQVKDCVAPNTCYVEPDETVGVCGCRETVLTDCVDSDEGRYGVCVDHPTAGFVCGPSYCNGFLQCSCFGGCAWWHEEDTLTPQIDALNDGLHCCEGTYPLGEETRLVAYYSNNSSCTKVNTDTEFAGCDNDADCDDSNNCTTDTCLADGSCQHSANAGDACTDITLADPECTFGICSAMGQCNLQNYPITQACGNDNSADECLGQDYCDGAGACDTAGNPEDTDVSCGSSFPTNECRNDDHCNGAGTCISEFIPENSACWIDSDNDTDDCIDGYACDDAGSCIQNNLPAGDDCAIDTDALSPYCWKGYCGTVIDAAIPSFGTASGACIPVQSALANDVCAGAISLGAFGNTDTNTLSVSSSTACAQDNYASAGADCYEGSGTSTSLGAGSRDLVYSFTYTTTESTQNDLYGFIIRVEGNYNSTVYAQTDSCVIDGTNAQPCLWHPQDPTLGASTRWEYNANQSGRDWSGNIQSCTSDNTGYEWCQRTGGWTYPADPTPCQFDIGGGINCGTYTGNVAQTVVHPISDEVGTTHTVYVYVDGAAGQFGNFTLTVERREWDNGQCERINDDPRVYDITNIPSSSQGIYRGNLERVANSDHNATFDTCGGYNCPASIVWDGDNAAHEPASVPNPFWPNAAYFKIQPDTATDYCIRTDATGVTNHIEAVVEVRRLTDNKDLCHGSYTPVAAELGSTGVELSAGVGETYLVLVSNYYEQAAACIEGSNTCNYRLIVEEGPCPPPAITSAITLSDNCVISTPSTVVNSCTAMGISPALAAGEIVIDSASGNTQEVSYITDSCTTYSYPLTNGNWSGMAAGNDSLVLITNDTLVDKDVTIQFWDHEHCNLANCADAADLYSAIFTCDGTLVSWPQRTWGPGKTMPPDTCVPGAVYHTEHIVQIPAGETYQFIGTAWNMNNYSIGCDGTYETDNGMGFHLDVSWADTSIPIGPCLNGGYEYPASSGICWYQGPPSLSCDSVCGPYAGCVEGALTTYGDDTAQCETILDNLNGITTGTVDGTTNVAGAGVSCSILDFGTGADTYYVDADTTTCNAADTTIARACPCTGSVGPTITCTSISGDSTNWWFDNGWDDQNSGATLSNVGGAIQLHQRASGQEFFWIGEHTTVFNLKAGSDYIVRADVLDSTVRNLANLYIGLSGAPPTNSLNPAALVPVSTALNTATFTTVEETFTPTMSGLHNFTTLLDFGSQLGGTTADYLIKNVEICADDWEVDTDHDTAVDTSCIPAGCGTAATATLPYVRNGILNECVFIPETATFNHENNWGWSVTKEYVYINSLALTPNQYISNGNFPATCNGGWYIRSKFITGNGHIEIQ